jgi:NADPH:quinone reductase-like Zn-dependent oxidoreductase
LKSVAVTTEDPLNRKGEQLFTRLFTGLKRPKNPILGAEFAGEIEATGRDVKRFNAGDRVFGTSGTAYGCYAEYVCMPEEGFLAIKPNRMSYEEAAPVCGAMAAWNHLVDKGKMKGGQEVLINGASGAVGSAAVQIARHFGATVTGVCSEKNIELVKNLGANYVLDYKEVDFAKSKQRFDIIYDVASKSSFSRCRKSLTQNGIYIRTVLEPLILLQMFLTSIIGKKKAIFSATGLRPVPVRLKLLNELIILFEREKLKTVIDRYYSLGQIVEAHKYLEEGRKKGNVVLKIEYGNKT